MKAILRTVTATMLALVIGFALAQTVTVRMATLPYFDYMGFVGAEALGLDEEMGLDLEFVPFPLESPAIQALARGSIDVGQGALGSLVPLLPQAQDIRVVLNNVQFKGFVFVGREGGTATFEDLLAQHGGDFDAAQQATLQQFEGKTILLVRSSFEGILKASLEQVGLTLEDVEVLDFQNDAQAAAAFLRGTGDLYTGSLPQQIRILREPGFVAVAGNEVLGPAGLWFSNTFVTDAYLEENRDTVLRLNAVYYRFMRYLHEAPEIALPPMIDFLNEQAAAGLSYEEALYLRDEFEDFTTVEGAAERVYDENSPTYWRIAMDNFVDQNEALGNIEPGSVDADRVVVQQELFNELLANQELMDWINSPLD